MQAGSSTSDDDEYEFHRSVCGVNYTGQKDYCKPLAALTLSLFDLYLDSPSACSQSGASTSNDSMSASNCPGKEQERTNIGQACNTATF